VRWKASIVGCVCIVAAASVLAQPQQQQRKIQTTAEQALGRAITLYATDNATTEAETLFKQVLATRPRVLRNEETAQYYLGRYYQRNYYMLKQTDGLDRAVNQYKALHDAAESDGVSRRWYAEARLYKGLACLELAKWRDAIDAVDQVRTTLDPDVEIDYLVWAASKRPLNTRVPSADVKRLYLNVMNSFAVSSKKSGQRDPKAVGDIVRALQTSFERTKFKMGSAP
jgi:tetratricopeptide (TPR) repeat protein